MMHSSFSYSSGMTDSGFWNSRCAPISLKLPWSCSRATKKTFYVIKTHVPCSFTDSTNRCKALHLESFSGGSGTAPWIISDSGAHLELQKPDIRHDWTIIERTMVWCTARFNNFYCIPIFCCNFIMFMIDVNRLYFINNLIILINTTLFSSCSFVFTFYENDLNSIKIKLNFWIMKT